VAGLAHGVAQQPAHAAPRAGEGGTKQAPEAAQGMGLRICSSHAAHDTASNAIRAPLPLQ
jgi:hypothetical protein